MAEDIRWPSKPRELHNHHFDAPIWNDLVSRDDDMIIATCGKNAAKSVPLGGGLWDAGVGVFTYKGARGRRMETRWAADDVPASP